MITSIDLPDDLYRKAKIAAAERGVKLKDVIREALEQNLGYNKAPAAKPSNPNRKRQLPAIVLERETSGGVVQVVSGEEIDRLLFPADHEKDVE